MFIAFAASLKSESGEYPMDPTMRSINPAPKNIAQNTKNGPLNKKEIQNKIPEIIFDILGAIFIKNISFDVISGASYIHSTLAKTNVPWCM